MSVNKAAAHTEQADNEYIMSLLQDLRESSPDNIVLSVYSGESVTEYRAYDLVSDVYAVGAVFVSMGLNRKTIAIAGECSYNWIVAYLAASIAGAAVLPINPSLSPTLMSQQMKLASTELAVCDKDCYKKVSDKSYSSVIMLDGETSFVVKDNIDSFITTGKKLISEGYRELETISRDKSDVAHIVFDSGAYGRDKAVVISGRGLYAQILNAGDCINDNDILINEHLCNTRTLTCVLAAVAMGSRVSIFTDAMPVFDKAYASEAELILMSPADARSFYVDIWQEATSQSLTYNLTKRMKHTVFFSKFGIKTRKTTAAYLRKHDFPIPKKILCFGNNIDSETGFGLHTLGIDLICCYEVPECGIVSYSRKSDGKNENLGLTATDVFVKTNKFGQLLVKSNTAMIGYLGEGTYPEHWIPTGDNGSIDTGFIVLQNDPQNVYITETAHRVFPQKIAEMVKKQVPYARTVNITIKDDEIMLSVSFDTDFMNITGERDIHAIVEASVAGVNKSLSEYERITRISVEDI